MVLVRQKGDYQMTIKAYTVYNLKMYRALTRLSMCRRFNPTIIMSCFSVIFAIGIIDCVYLFIMKKSSMFLLMIALLLLCAALFYFMYFGLAYVSYKSAAKLAGAKNEYIFRDGDMSIVSVSADYRGAVTLKYTMIYKVMETSKYFFIYQTKRGIYPVDKANIEGGTAADIRALLSPVLGKKYIVCRY